MSVEIAWKQNILVTDFQLLKSLLVVLGFGLQAFVCGFSRQNICSVFLSFISSIMQKNKLFFCKTDQLHFRILWIVLRSSFGKTNFIKDSPLPNPFWKLQNWDCFNAGLVYCARAICQKMYQIAINMSRYKYTNFPNLLIISQFCWCCDIFCESKVRETF